MEQIKLVDITTSTKLDSLPKEEIIQKYTVIEQELVRVIKENYELRNKTITDDQLNLILQEQISELQNTLYGSSSERYKKSDKPKAPKGPDAPRIKRPSERYPNIPVVEKIISIAPLPNCTCCGSGMSDSGMTEDSEQLTVIPKKYEITLLKRKKYRCGKCHGDVQTAPSPERIIPGSTYSDEMIIDVALTKYCDLIPIERYVAMAQRSGVMDIPPHSLIELTHGLADYLQSTYALAEAGILNERVLNADETPHKMLEGSDKKSWYLWGFSTVKICYLSCRDTRSGDVANEILIKSKCEVLVTDVYSGYKKAVRLTNIERAEKKIMLVLKSGYCNAHARRYFFKSIKHDFKVPEFYMDQYHEIYELNKQSKGKPPDEVLKLRDRMRVYFKSMRDRAVDEMLSYSNKSQYAKALSYFVGNYEGLTLFLDDAEVPMDNNAQERLLRSHVVGRKTWYGTHSERGAKTAAILFTLVESCKLNHVNPREYFANLIDDLHQGAKPYLPHEFKCKLDS